MAETAPVKKVSQSETGHARNVANFGELAVFVETFGAIYSPANAAIALPALKTLRTSLAAVMAKVGSLAGPYKDAVNKRQEAFEGMSVLATRTLAAVIAVATPREAADAGGFVKKIRGGGKKLKTADPAVDAKPHSTSQMSFGNRLQNFRDLSDFLGNIPAYVPNEKDLKVAAINAYLNACAGTNDKLARAALAYYNARSERNKLLYGAGSGAVDISKKVKSYIKSIYGPKSPEFKRAAKIEFTKLT